jgi:hypothetical protein
MTELKPGVIGYLILEDVLNKTDIVIDGISVDAIVDVLIKQDGSFLEVEDITIDGKMLDLEHKDGTLEYRLTGNVDDAFMTEFYDRIVDIALLEARNTSEDFWQYREE